VRSGKGEETLAHGGLPKGTFIFTDLNEAVQHIIAEDE
jgi:hypothetical protein